jgi:hypothetical protein
MQRRLDRSGCAAGLVEPDVLCPPVEVVSGHAVLHEIIELAHKPTGIVEPPHVESPLRLSSRGMQTITPNWAGRSVEGLGHGLSEDVSILM